MDRHMIVGRAMDATTLEFLFAMCKSLFLNKWSPQITSVTSIPTDHYAQHTVAMSVYSSTPIGDKNLHWWQVDRDTPVGGLGMAFASLQGASSETHQAQQLRGEKYPQSDVWGDPIFWIISVFISTRMICLKKRGDTSVREPPLIADSEIGCTTLWWTGLNVKCPHQRLGDT